MGEVFSLYRIMLLSQSYLSRVPLPRPLPHHTPVYRFWNRFIWHCVVTVVSIYIIMCTRHRARSGLDRLDKQLSVLLCSSGVRIAYSLFTHVCYSAARISLKCRSYALSHGIHVGYSPARIRLKDSALSQNVTRLYSDPVVQWSHIIK